MRRIGSRAKTAAAPRMMNTRPSNDGGLSSGAVSVGGVVTVGVRVGRGVAVTAKLEVPGVGALADGERHAVDVRAHCRDAGPDRDLQAEERGVRVLVLEGG